MRIDAFKWSASKIMPKVYGDKLTLAGDQENPLLVAQRLDFSELTPDELALLRIMVERRIRERDGPLIEAKAEPVEPEFPSEPES